MNFEGSLGYSVRVSIACGIVTFVITVLYLSSLAFVLPKFATDKGAMDTIITVVPLVGVFIIFLGTLFLFSSFIAWVLSMLEVLTAKRDISQKLLWVVALLSLSYLGVLLYYIFGRKNLPKE